MEAFNQDMSGRDRNMAVLELVIQTRYQCTARHIVSEIVYHASKGRVEIEVFEVFDRADAKYCFAWARESGGRNDVVSRFITMLNIPPVSTPHSAVDCWAEDILLGVSRAEADVSSHATHNCDA